MTLDLATWQARVLGRPLDVDGQFGGQCWDLWSHYATTVLGIPYVATVTRAGGIKPHAGYACNVFHNAETAPAVHERLARVGPGAGARRGDVAFWERSKLFPGSHVAIVLADLGDRLATLSQNPGPPQLVTLPKESLLGYLRPRARKLAAEADPAPPPPTPTREDPPTMYRIRDVATGAVYLVTDGGLAHIKSPAHNELFDRMLRTDHIEDLNSVQVGNIAAYIAATRAHEHASLRDAVELAAAQIQGANAEQIVDALHERLAPRSGGAE